MHFIALKKIRVPFLCVWLAMVVSLKSREGRPDLAAVALAAVENEITLEVPSTQASFAELIDILTYLLCQTPLAPHGATDLLVQNVRVPQGARDLMQAIVEMAGNAMEWGHGFRPELCVEINYRVRPDAVTVRVRDHGAGFDMGELNDRSGFGIMLARALVDEFSYNEVGNEVRLVKRFTKSS